MKTIRPPVAHPKKQVYVPPPSACDAHCHVFGSPKKSPYPEKRPYAPGEPASRKRLAKLYAHLGRSRSVIVQATSHGTDNRAMLAAIVQRRAGTDYAGATRSRGRQRKLNAMIDHAAKTDNLVGAHLNR